MLRAAGPYVAAALIVLTLTFAFAQITPAMQVNDGWGYDGVTYAEMTYTFRGESDGQGLAARPHFAYRPLVPWLVAKWRIEDVRAGFMVLNLVALIASGPALLALLRAYGVATGLGLLAVFVWATLPASLRFAIYYPVLVDGVGLFVMVAALAAAAWRRVALFAVLLALGVLVRENLVVLGPFLWLRLLPGGWRRATTLTAAAVAPALVAYAVVRIAPPIPPPAQFSVLFEMGQNVGWLLGNANDRAWRFVLAGPVTLGMLVLVPLIRSRASLAFLRLHPEWGYYLVATLAVIVVIGADYDRYFLYFAPALLALTFVAARDVWRSLPRAAALIVAHLLVVRAGWPVDPSAEGYLSYNVATMRPPELVAAGVMAAATLLPAAALVFLARAGLARGNAPVVRKDVHPGLTG